MPVAALLYTWYSITRNAHDPQLKSDRVALQNTAVCRVNRTVLQHVYSKHLPAEQLTHSLILWNTAVDPARQATRKPLREQKTNTCSTGHRTLTIYHTYIYGGGVVCFRSYLVVYMCTVRTNAQAARTSTGERLPVTVVEVWARSVQCVARGVRSLLFFFGGSG